MSKATPKGPLTPAVFHILLAVNASERHGHEIRQQVKEDSRGAVKMGPGTLCGSLDRMIAAGLVIRSNTRDPPRIHYKLTAVGSGDAEGRKRAAVSGGCRRSAALEGYIVLWHRPNRAERLDRWQSMDRFWNSTRVRICSGTELRCCRTSRISNKNRPPKRLDELRGRLTARSLARNSQSPTLDEQTR